MDTSRGAPRDEDAEAESSATGTPRAAADEQQSHLTNDHLADDLADMSVAQHWIEGCIDRAAAKIKSALSRLTVASATGKALTGLSSIGAFVGMALRWHDELGPTVTTFGQLLIIVAGGLWLGRVSLHVGMGRLAHRGLRGWTVTEMLLCGGWTLAGGNELIPGLNLPVLAVAVIGALTWVLSFAVAQWCEQARTEIEFSFPISRRFPGYLMRGGDWIRAWREGRPTSGRSLLEGVPLANQASQQQPNRHYSRLVGAILTVALAGAVALGLAHVTPTDAGRGEFKAGERQQPRAPKPVSTVQESTDTTTAPGHQRSSAAPGVGVLNANVPTVSTPDVAASSTPNPMPTTYDGTCVKTGQGQEPGADVSPSLRDRFTALFLGPGANHAGCAQATQTSRDGGCSWEQGVLDGTVMSVAVVDDQYGDALFLGDLAPVVIDDLKTACVGGSAHHLLASGDVQLLQRDGGTQAFIRTSEKTADGPTPHSLVQANVVAAWLRAMELAGQWLWPVAITATETALENTDLIPTGAIIDSGTNPSSSVLREPNARPVTVNAAEGNWSQFAAFAP